MQMSYCDIFWRIIPQIQNSQKQIIERGAFTVPEVLAEVVYVLKGVYGISRIEIADTLIGFLKKSI